MHLQSNPTTSIGPSPQNRIVSAFVHVARAAKHLDVFHNVAATFGHRYYVVVFKVAKLHAVGTNVPGVLPYALKRSFGNAIFQSFSTSTSVRFARVGVISRQPLEFILSILRILGAPTPTVFTRFVGIGQDPVAEILPTLFPICFTPTSVSCADLFAGSISRCLGVDARLVAVCFVPAVGAIRFQFTPRWILALFRQVSFVPNLFTLATSLICGAALRNVPTATWPAR